MVDSNIINAVDKIAQLGYAAIDAGDPRAAARHFERLTRLAPDNADYQYMTNGNGILTRVGCSTIWQRVAFTVCGSGHGCRVDACPLWTDRPRKVA